MKAGHKVISMSLLMLLPVAAKPLFFAIEDGNSFPAT